ncbi:alcohol dehydrogenase [Streptomyces brasiliensis]|uniref:Alcohol dehydrogenase n=1 Tax=Streptomyces brasiliensis TaxID=1954 RepID=A0A917L0J2_9ACTN|nr:alcohol dehydrogenase [Streptomyces brasiliensis]
MNRRVVHTRGGSPADVLTVIEEPEPAAPERGQALIRTTAFPVHPGDLQAVGAYSGAAAEPVPVGVEATGVAAAIGPDTHVAPGVEIGSRVTVFPQPGAWSQWIVADAEVAVAVPDELSDEVAAQLLANPLTTVMLRCEAQDYLAFGYDGCLVQTAAGSSVGRLVTGVCRFHSFALVNVVRSERGAAELRKRSRTCRSCRQSIRAGLRRSAGRRRADGECGLRPDRREAGGEPSGSADAGREAGHGLIAEEPIPVHASTLLSKSLTLRGKNIVGGWRSEASAERRASDIATAKQIALGLTDQLDVAAAYGLDELAEAVGRHRRCPSTAWSLSLIVGGAPGARPYRCAPFRPTKRPSRREGSQWCPRQDSNLRPSA